ncbi:MAG: metal-sensitive transcriptional regulator [Chloroflexi bacterium]|nr:metal-sensitive transcriptional regulator [Chloroflexota bacterium]
MVAKSRADVIHRLRSTAGHINGIIRMVEEDRCCIDVIKQIQAAQTALQRVSEGLLDEHLQTCVTVAIQGDDTHKREQLLAEIIDIFCQSNRSRHSQGDYFHVEQNLQNS